MTCRLLFASLILFAACDLGIGSDPNRGPRSACAAGHDRLGPTSGCFVVQGTMVIDGAVDDWAAVPAIPVAPPCIAAPCDGLVPTAVWIAAGAASDGDDDLIVRAAFGAPPPTSASDLRIALTVAASPIRPATGGTDRLVIGAVDSHYEKSGYIVTANPPPYRWAWTSDGFEAEIDAAWLTYQGAARISVTVEREQAAGWLAVAPTALLDACWGWRSGSDALGATACEVAPR